MTSFGYFVRVLGSVGGFVVTRQHANALLGIPFAQQLLAIQLVDRIVGVAMVFEFLITQTNKVCVWKPLKMQSIHTSCIHT